MIGKRRRHDTTIDINLMRVSTDRSRRFSPMLTFGRASNPPSAKNVSSLLTCSLMSCSCCCNFCMSLLLLVSLPPLFINGPWFCAASLVDGFGSSSTSAFTSEMVPRPPLHTARGTISSICERHMTHFFMIWEQLSQAHMWPQGLNNTVDFLSEQTRHSSIWKKSGEVEKFERDDESSNLDPVVDRFSADEALLHPGSAQRATSDVAAGLEQHVPLGVRTDQTFVQGGRDVRVLIVLIGSHVHLAALLVLVAFRECLAQVRVGTQVQRGLSFLILQGQVGTVAGQEAGDARRRLLVGALGAQTHQQLTHVLDVLQLAQLRQSVVAQGFVERSVAVFVGHVQIGTFSDEKLEEEQEIKRSRRDAGRRDYSLGQFECVAVRRRGGGPSGDSRSGGPCSPCRGGPAVRPPPRGC
jgi:hypothetical protein